jgi:hypothetical protein
MLLIIIFWSILSTLHFLSINMFYFLDSSHYLCHIQAILPSRLPPYQSNPLWWYLSLLSLLPVLPTFKARLVLAKMKSCPHILKPEGLFFGLRMKSYPAVECKSQHGVTGTCLHSLIPWLSPLSLIEPCCAMEQSPLSSLACLLPVCPCLFALDKTSSENILWNFRSVFFL